LSRYKKKDLLKEDSLKEVNPLDTSVWQDSVRCWYLGINYILGYRQDNQGLWVPYAAGHRHFFSTNCPNQLWNSPRLLLSRYWSSFPAGKEARPWNLTHLLNADMKDLHIQCFTLSLKRFLCHHSFYSVEEYYELTDDKDTYIDCDFNPIYFITLCNILTFCT
jgi:hypothetical protein